VAVAPSFDLLERARAREEALVKRGGFARAPDPVGAVPDIEPYASQALRTIVPRENGGNLDVPQVCVGGRLLLPVHVAGAMLSVGDPHFAQGNGEVCGTAIEVAATVRLRVSLRPAEEIAWVPRFPAVEFSELPALADARRFFMTTGIPLTDDGQNRDLDLVLAARQALREMVAWLTDERGLSAEQGYLLASVAADLRIAEAVNRPNGVVVCCMPLNIFE
jgi:formamidase